MKHQYIPINTLRRSGEKLDAVELLVAHDTGNIGSTAIQNVSYYIRSANEMSASAHIFVDDKEAICCIPLDEKAWGVRYNVNQDDILFGFQANDRGIHLEMCYGGKIDNKKAYERYVSEFANLCRIYNLDPMKKIAGHFQLDPARRTDPMGALQSVGKDWDTFLKDVNNKKNRLSIITRLIQFKNELFN